MTPAQEAELERARRMYAQKCDRLRKSRETLLKATDALAKAMKNVEHDLIMCVAAMEDLEDGKETAA